MNGISELGSKLDKVGGDLTKKLTLPITGLVGGIVKVGAEFESQMSRVGALSGATGEDFKALEGKAKELGATTKFSATESAQALEYMAMSGWKTEEMLNGIDGVLNLAAASGEGLALVADIVSDSMTAFGIEASESSRFADVLAGTVSNANTNVAMMGESFKYVAPLAGALGFSIEDTSLAIGLMANSGIKGSQAGTALRSTITRLVKPTDDSAQAMKDLGISITDDKGDMLSLREVMDTMRESFGDLTQAEKASNAALIAGQEGMSGLLSIVNASESDFKKLTFAIDNSTGSAKRMADEMQNNLMGKFTVIKSSLEGLALQFYDVMKPVLNKVADGIQGFINFLSSLDEQSKKTILIVAGVVASIGPILLIIGQVISLAGTLGSTLALLTGPVGLVVAGIVGLTVAGIELYKHFSQQLIPEIEHFAEGVSESTQEATKYFLKMNEEVTRDLKTLSITGQEITEEMKDSITSNIKEMGSDAKIAINNAKEDALSALKNLLDGSVALSEEEKEIILANTEQTYDEKIDKITHAEKMITGIMAKASEEKRALTEGELIVIQAYQEEIAEQGIKHMTESELEQKVILERMKENVTLITAQQSAEAVKNSIEQKEKVIAEAEEQYNSVIAEVIKQRDESGTISSEQADLLIRAAQKQKAETIKGAEEMHERIVEEAKTQAGEHVNAVDWETGEILTKWDVFKTDVAKTIDGIIAHHAEQWDDAATYTIETWKNIKDSTGKIWNDIKDGAIETWNELKESTKETWNELKESTKETWTSIKSYYKNTLDSMQNTVTDFFIRMADNWGKAWDNLKSMFNDKWESISRIIETSLNNVVKIFAELPKTLRTYGQYIIEGFWNGINDKAKWLTSKISGFFGGVVDNIKGFFGIHSPSRLFRDEIGKNLVLGLAEGIDKNAEKAEKEAEKLSKAVFEKSKEWIDDYRDSTEYLATEELKMWQILLEEYSDNAKMKKEIKTNIAKVEEQIEQESFEHSKKWIQERKKFGLLTMEEEIEAWTRVSDRYEEGTKRREESDKQLFETQKKWIEERRDLGLITAQEEVEAWELVSERYEIGSKQREDADKQLFASQERLFKESEDLLKKMADAEEKYQKAVDDRALAIYNTFGLFDELKEKEDVSTKTLLDNLESQVLEMHKWADNIDYLAKRGIEEGLLDELRKMGPSANSYLSGLVNSTDNELERYQDLWREKHHLAREAAIDELKGLREETNNEIQGLLSDLTNTMSSETHPIGENMIYGIMAGIESQAVALRETMRNVMNDVIYEANTTLDIHSPSRVFSKIGNFIGLGVIEGLTGVQDKITSTVNKVFGEDLLDSIPELEIEDKINFNLDTIKSMANELNPFSSAHTNPPSTNKTEVTINTEGLFKGANLSIRNEHDIVKLAEEVIKLINNIITDGNRGFGLGGA